MGYFAVDQKIGQIRLKAEEVGKLYAEIQSLEFAVLELGELEDLIQELEDKLAELKELIKE